MYMRVVTEWIMNLDDEEILFAKRFILASGSLKELAKEYGVTYPTIRLKLDKLIQRIQMHDDMLNIPYIELIKRMAIEDKIDFESAKILINEYKKIEKNL